ncbi:MAG TPA: anhydro-N-acetylmuramic acid kinase [Saprospiraceae bacterium]|nr:anhydro-N-acetylmuramic acid kinase [Saprospiraceae bacterium]
MAIKSWDIIGLMSGSSLDGVDIANCHFEVEDDPEFKILSWEITAGDIFPFSAKILYKLKNVSDYNGLKLTEFDRELGSVFGEMIKSFCEKHQICPDYIASHGHTVYHYPSFGYTLQIGHPANIAATTGLPVIGDFRSMDVALGGQGAPFAPIVDYYLFKDYQVLINLGGIVNICFLKENNKVVAFDVCPGNQALNYIALQNGLSYDYDGKYARSGTIQIDLYSKLGKWPFFALPFPKSLDNSDIKKSFLPILDEEMGNMEDKLYTLVLLISTLIKQAFNSMDVTKNPNVLITGGGAFNNYLVEEIKKQLDNTIVVVPEGILVNFKEALLMGLMGLLRIYHLNNVLCSVTGSKMDHCAGAIYPGTIKSKNEIN